MRDISTPAQIVALLEGNQLSDKTELISRLVTTMRSVSHSEKDSVISG